MRRFLMAGLTLLAAYAASDAQTAIVPLGIGAKSPLGMSGTNSGAVSFTGAEIPLGATEINPGGLGPTVGSSCNASGLTSGKRPTSSSPSTFDGGGLTQGDNCAASSGSRSTSSEPSTSNSGVVGSSIPLGATETGTAGLSPMPAVRVPNASAYGATNPGHSPPCATGSGLSMTGDTAMSTGSFSSGC